MTDTLRRNGHLVEMLGSALRDGGHALDAVPGLLKQLLAEKGWRKFETQRGERKDYERFADFAAAPPLAGLGASVSTVRKLLVDDGEALDLLDEELRNPVGHPRKGNNITRSKRPGTSKEQALRRLRKDAPELHAEVIAGRLKANAAMVQAGFRPRTSTVRIDDPASVARTLRAHMTADQLTALAHLLLAEASS
jgi:hypothetical protein